MRFRRLIYDAAGKVIGHEPVAEPPAPKKPPGLLRRAVNFAGALAGHVAAGLPQAAPEEKERRLSLCQVCPSLLPETGVCAECGCVVEKKASWAGQRCPLGRW